MRIKRLRADRCYVTDTVTGSSEEAPYTSHAIMISGVDGLKLQANKREIERLEAECALVEATVDLAPNSLIRYAMELRYLDGRPWSEVAAQIALSGSEATEDSIKQKVHRYLDAVEKQQKKPKKGKAG